MKYEQAVICNIPEQAFLIRSRIQLAAKTVATAGIRISFRNRTDERFLFPIAFGAEWAASRLPLTGNREGLDITVFFVEHEHLGPRVSILALLAALCTCDALGIKTEEKPRFDEHQRTVIWPL